MPKNKTNAAHDEAVFADLMGGFDPTEAKAEEETDIPAPKEPEKLLAFRLPVSERREFKEWCTRHDMKMASAFQLAFKLLKQKEGA